MGLIAGRYKVAAFEIVVDVVVHHTVEQALSVLVPGGRDDLVVVARVPAHVGLFFAAEVKAPCGGVGRHLGLASGAGGGAAAAVGPGGEVGRVRGKTRKKVRQTMTRGGGGVGCGLKSELWSAEEMGEE